MIVILRVFKVLLQKKWKHANWFYFFLPMFYLFIYFEMILKLEIGMLKISCFLSLLCLAFSTEDEQQQKSLSCSKSVRQLTAERDQAIADLNSVERSFADLFRRYENMKGVLEGFKKVSRALVYVRMTSFSRVILTIYPPRNCPEWGRVEEVCTGLPDANQTGGAAISNPQSARWGETEQVKLLFRICNIRTPLAWLLWIEKGSLFETGLMRR